MDKRTRARHRRLTCCIIGSTVVSGLVTWLMSQRHAALAAATAGRGAASPHATLGGLLFVLDALLTLVTFTVASILAARRRASGAREQEDVGRPAPRRRRQVQEGRR
jgi:hypothetical protein